LESVRADAADLRTHTHRTNHIGLRRR